MKPGQPGAPKPGKPGAPKPQRPGKPKPGQPDESAPDQEVELPLTRFEGMRMKLRKTTEGHFALGVDIELALEGKPGEGKPEGKPGKPKPPSGKPGRPDEDEDAPAARAFSAADGEDQDEGEMAFADEDEDQDEGEMALAADDEDEDLESFEDEDEEQDEGEMALAADDEDEDLESFEDEDEDEEGEMALASDDEDQEEEEEDEDESLRALAADDEDQDEDERAAAAPAAKPTKWPNRLPVPKGIMEITQAPAAFDDPDDDDDDDEAQQAPATFGARAAPAKPAKPSKGTVKGMLAAARKTLGLRETPPGSDRNKIVTWYNKHIKRIGPGPWCNMAVTYWAGHSGNLKAIFGGKGIGYAYTVWHAQKFQKKGRWRNGVKGIKPGDIVFFNWEGSHSIGKIDHVGIVEKVKGNKIITIEGNTSGDRCKRQVRTAKSIVGYGRPAYGK